MKKRVVIFSAFLILIGCFFLGFSFSVHEKKEKSNSKEEVSLMLKKDLQVEIHKEVSLSSFLARKSQYPLVNEDEMVDTSKLGEQELCLEYLVGEEKKQTCFTIQVVDTVAPIIEHTQDLSTSIGQEIDLLASVTARDNSLETIQVHVEGTYDFQKEGVYDLKYVAEDSSHNRKEVSFSLSVLKKDEESSTPSINQAEPPKVSIQQPTKDVTQNVTQEENEVVWEKYGTKYLKVNQYQVTMVNGKTMEKKLLSTKNHLDTSGYHASSAELEKEARELVVQNQQVFTELLGYVNEYRRIDGAEPLVLDQSLSIAATVRALEVAYTDSVVHERPDQRDFYTVLNDLGLSYMTAGENLAGGQSNASRVAEGWRNSSGHNQNMINANFHKIGLGMVVLPGTTYEIYWSQLFTN